MQNIDDEQILLDGSIELFRSLQASVIPNDYFALFPESAWIGQARQLIRQYMKQRIQVGPIVDEEKQEVAGRVCAYILSDIFDKTKVDSAAKNIERDGAELFFRRALSHMARERFADAERALTQSVQIDESFIEAWEALLEVLNHNGKEELAAQVKSKLRSLS